MRFQLLFLMCIIAKGFSQSSFTCNYCDSGAYSNPYLIIDPTSQNMANCTNATTGTGFQVDCSKIGYPNPIGGDPLIPDKYYCVRIDYTNTTGSIEVLRTCSPTGFNGKICSLQGGTEICGYVTSCSTNNCNSEAYTGTDPEVPPQQQGNNNNNNNNNGDGGSNGGSSILSVGHLVSSVIGMCTTLFLYH